MKTIMSILAVFCLCFVGCVAKTVTPDLQAVIDSEKPSIVALAADPTVVAAVKAQNQVGPIVGMTDGKWAELSPSDPVVRTLEQNEAGMLLSRRVTSSNGRLTEAFLCGDGGEKAALTQKTTYYFHNWSTKFNAAAAGETWVGKPKWDASAGKYSVQIATPVLEDGKCIGVLVVGVAATKTGGFVWPWDWTWTPEDGR